MILQSTKDGRKKKKKNGRKNFLLYRGDLRKEKIMRNISSVDHKERKGSGGGENMSKTRDEENQNGGMCSIYPPTKSNHKSHSPFMSKKKKNADSRFQFIFPLHSRNRQDPPNCEHPKKRGPKLSEREIKKEISRSTSKPPHPENKKLG